jgi:hypothetical protein
MFKVDINIRGLVSLAAYKASKQQVNFFRIYGSNAKAKADSRVGRSSASLT